MSIVQTPLDPGLNSLDLLFDHDALSALFNRPVRTGHLRWKRATSAVARLVGISQPSVSEWKRNGIPQAREQYLRLLRPEAFVFRKKA